MINDDVIMKIEENPEIVECPFCKEYYGSGDIMQHYEKCMNEQDNKKCRNCDEVVKGDFQTHNKVCAGLNVNICKDCDDVVTTDMTTHKMFCHKLPVVDTKKCKNCGENVKEEFEVHNKICTANSIKQCQFCQEYYGSMDLANHEKICYKKKDSKPKPKPYDKKDNDMFRTCKICDEVFGVLDLAEHEKRCMERESKLDEDEKFAITQARLFLKNSLVNDMQFKALEYVQARSWEKSKKAYSNLLNKFKSIGFGKVELDKTLKFIRFEAPIIIHFRAQLLDNFLKDDHYKNRFELMPQQGGITMPSIKPKHLGKMKTPSLPMIFGGLSGRAGWEQRMFNKIYDQSSAYDRVKYGVLNIVNDPSGVKNCYGYGESYFVLNNDTCRLRTSFASMDTSSATVELASCENYGHVLETFTDQELKDVVLVATKKRFCVGSDKIGNYKEIQIHGPVLWNRDISMLVLNNMHKTNKDIVSKAEKFCSINKINLVWMEG